MPAGVRLPVPSRPPPPWPPPLSASCGTGPTVIVTAAPADAAGDASGPPAGSLIPGRGVSETLGETRMEREELQAVAWAVFSTGPGGRIYDTFDLQVEADAIVDMLAKDGGGWEAVPLYRHAPMDMDLRLNLISCRAVCKELTKANADLRLQLDQYGGVRNSTGDATRADQKQRFWELNWSSSNWGKGVARDIVVLENTIEGLRSRISELEKHLP